MKFIQLFIFLIVSLVATVQAQHPNWQNKDLTADSIFGISTEKAYAELLNHKKVKKPVVVAVLDGGVDTAHEDLVSVIWKNPKEKYDGLDDDHNGYVDDVHGWDFIGGAKGDVNQDNLEITRIVRQHQADSVKSDSIKIMEKELHAKLEEAKGIVSGMSAFRTVLDTVVFKMGTKNPTITDFQNYTPSNGMETQVKMIVLQQLGTDPDYEKFISGLDQAIDHYQTSAEYQLNMDFDPRYIVGDDYNNINQRYYGNSDVKGPKAEHATHVSGIIAAVRNNGIGINGIADHVQIMSVRVVPDGDERDKDIANGIRYAVDNGAKVINMSFGKPYSPGKATIDEAVKYAMSKDVLMVQGSGNDGKNLDSVKSYPNPVYADGSGVAAAWINVGATGEKDDSTLIANFSNYGKTTVDVFAPGVQIYSSVPGNKYDYYDGTSMASPVVAGLAALIREYYPKLTAVQVKDIIMRSVVKRDILKDKSISGGVVNAYNALLLAQHYK